MMNGSVSRLAKADVYYRSSDLPTFNQMTTASHVCTSDCECRADLSAALEGLESASRLLSASIFSGFDGFVEVRYAAVRCATAKVAGAFAAYREHFAEA
jgi:hypothetical protein